MAKEIKRSVCPYDCPDTCGLLVEVVEVLSNIIPWKCGWRRF